MGNLLPKIPLCPHSRLINTAKGWQAQLSQFRIGHELVQRGITRHYSEKNLVEDLAYASGQ